MALDYEPLDMAEVATESQRVNTESTSMESSFTEKLVQLPERDGFVMMRFMPRKKGHKLHCATRTHRLINPSDPNDKGRSYHCPKELVMTDRGPRWQGECIICKYYNDLWQKSEKLSGKAQEDLQAQARAIKPVERYYYNVMVRQEKDKKTGDVKKNVGPKIFSCGKTVHAKIMRAIIGDSTTGEKPLGDITHPTNGRDFRLVKRTVKGGGGAEYPNYDSSKFEDVSPLGEMDEMEVWMNGLHDLTTLRVLKTPDELKHALKVHLGLVKEEVQADDLAEFRGSPVAQVQTQDAIETVREELLSRPAPSVTKVENSDEPLADEDFLNELNNM